MREKDVCFTLVQIYESLVSLSEILVTMRFQVDHLIVASGGLTETESELPALRGHLRVLKIHLEETYGVELSPTSLDKG